MLAVSWWAPELRSVLGTTGVLRWLENKTTGEENRELRIILRSREREDRKEWQRRAAQGNDVGMSGRGKADACAVAGLGAAAMMNAQRVALPDDDSLQRVTEGGMGHDIGRRV